MRLRRHLASFLSAPGLKKNIGVLSAMVLLGSAAYVWTLSHQGVAWPWEDLVAYRADFVEAPSVAPGKQDVLIAGVRAGKVTKAEVTKQGHARLTLSLERRYASVFDNARAVLRPVSPVNDMYVLLDPGGPSGRRLPPGSVIPTAQTVRPVQVDEVLNHLDTRARKALGSLVVELDDALARPQSVAPTLEAAGDTLTSLRPVVEALATRREGLTHLVTALADIATAVGGDDARLTRVLDDARSALGALSSRDAELDATLTRLPGVTDDLRGASEQIQALAGELDPTLDAVRVASDRLPGAVSGVRTLVDQLDGTLDRGAPVVSAARPLMDDLRPLMSSAHAALGDVAAFSPRFDPITANLVRYLPWVQQAVYEVASLVSLNDVNGPFIRPPGRGGSESFSPPSDPSSREPRSSAGLQQESGR